MVRPKIGSKFVRSLGGYEMSTLGFALVAFVVAGLIGILIRWRKGYPILGLKEFCKWTIYLVGLVWVMCLVIGGIIFLVPFVNYIDFLIDSKAFPSSSLLLLGSLPIFYLITLLALAVYVLFVVSKSSWIKFTDKEKAFLGKESERWRKVPIIRWFVKR